MFSFIYELLFNKDIVSVDTVDEFDRYYSKYSNKVGLDFTISEKKFYYLSVNGKPIPVGRMIFEDNREYTEKANAQAYYVQYCKDRFEK